jgi:hypothetical protein
MADITTLVNQCQIHHHSFTCEKYWLQKQKQKQRARKQSTNVAAHAGDRYQTCNDNADPYAAAASLPARETSSDHARGADTDAGIPQHAHGSTDTATRAALNPQQQQAAMERAERTKCRFAFPRPLCERPRFATLQDKQLASGVKERDVILPRYTSRDRYVNNYNPLLLAVWQGNMDIQPVADAIAAISYIIKYICKDEKSEEDLVRATMRGILPGTSLKTLLQRMVNCLLTNREVSKQEASMLLLGLPLYFSTRSSIFITALPECMRQKRSKTRKALQKMDGDDADVWQEDAVQQYQLRPQDPLFEDMTLFEWCTWFQPQRRNKSSQTEAAFHDDIRMENEDDIDDHDADQSENGITTSTVAAHAEDLQVHNGTAASADVASLMGVRYVSDNQIWKVNPAWLEKTRNTISTPPIIPVSDNGARHSLGAKMLRLPMIGT